MSGRPAPEALALHRESIVVDGLNVSRWHEPVYHALRDAGCTAVNATVTIRHGFRDTIELIGDWLRDFERYADVLMQVRSAADIQRAHGEGRVGVVLGFQNASPIENQVDFLRVFHRLGVRVVQLTYNAGNLVGDGFLEPRDAGLTSFGREVVQELNRLGILIDLSHTGYRTTMEVIELSQHPVAFTHANASAICPTSRNKSDEQLRALAGRGGVVGATAFPTTLPEGKRHLEGFLETVDYLVEAVGVDHVGIGLDHVEGQPREYFMTKDRWGVDVPFPADYVPPEWPPAYPEGLRTIRDWPNVTDGLLRRGYAEQDVRKIIGANFLRLFGQVWDAGS